MNTALVTGGSKGLGQAIADGLRDKGWDVFAPSQMVMDITSPTDIKRMVAAIDKLDVLVNNAGIYPERRDIMEFSSAAMIEALKVNVVATANVTRAFWNKLKESKGRVINISSRFGLTDYIESDRAGYAVSKNTLNFITRMFAIQGRRDGISVNAMCPGHCRTDMGGENAPYSPAEGADTAIWLASEAPQELTGGFYIARRLVPW